MSNQYQFYAYQSKVSLDLSAYGDVFQSASQDVHPKMFIPGCSSHTVQVTGK